MLELAEAAATPPEDCNMHVSKEQLEIHFMTEMRR